jgi:hypothetical protein
MVNNYSMDQIQQSDSPMSDHINDGHHKSILTLSVISIFMLLLGFAGGYVFFSFKTPSVLPQITKSSPTLNPQSATPTPSIESTVQKGWHTYTSIGDKIAFDYPSDWALEIRRNPYIAPSQYPEAEDFKLTTTDNNYSFTLSMILSAQGVGGGCPDFNPTKNVITTKNISILKENVYLIYYGDKAKNTVAYIYALNQPDGYCPNVAFIEIPHLPGLFAATLSYEPFDPDGPDRTISLDDKNVAVAEKILQSLRFTK